MSEWLNKNPAVGGVVTALGAFVAAGMAVPPLLYLMMIWWRFWLS